MKKILIPVFSFLTLVACGASGESDQDSKPTSENSEHEAQSGSDEEVQSRYQYDVEWEAFKKAVVDQDAETIKGFMQPEDLMDPNDLILSLQDPMILDQMNATSYEELTDSEFNGNYAKEFSVNMEYTDEDGNTYESAVFLYFEEGLDGLRLVNVLMAG